MAQNTNSRVSVTAKATDSLPPNADAQLFSWRSLAFWLVFVGLCLAELVSATDATIILAALPTIADDHVAQDGGLYIWLGAACALSSTATMPFPGQLADILSCRNHLFVSVAHLALPMLIVGHRARRAGFCPGRLPAGAAH